MKVIYTMLIFNVMASPVFAEAPGKPVPLFADVPPPPLIAPADVASCCTDAGRLSWVNPTKDNLPIEGAVCEAKSADGLQSGTICY